jgi:hypothetical protein
MPKVEQNGMPTSLHYASYVQTLNVADVADRMEGGFEVINQRKYTSRHCNQDYAVRIDTVKVELEKEKQQEAYWKMSLGQ